MFRYVRVVLNNHPKLVETYWPKTKLQILWNLVASLRSNKCQKFIANCLWFANSLKKTAESFATGFCCSMFLFIWVFPKIGIPQNGWFIIETPIKMDDLGVPPFTETTIYCLSKLVLQLWHFNKSTSDKQLWPDLLDTCASFHHRLDLDELTYTSAYNIRGLNSLYWQWSSHLE